MRCPVCVRKLTIRISGVARGGGIRMHGRLTAILASGGLAACPSIALAHAAEDGFVLLLPTHIYLPAGVAAFAVTALVLMLLSGPASMRLLESRPLGHAPVPEWVVTASSVISTAFLFGLILIGLWGPHDPLENLLPLMVWSSFWAGFVLLHMLIGDLWRWIDPWAGLCRLVVGAAARPVLHLPDWVGHWPAVVLFILFTGFSIVDPVPADPERLARVVGGYWLFTFVGMVLFGPKAWSTRCEVFGLFFQLLSNNAWVRLVPAPTFGLPGRTAVLAPLPHPSIAVFCLVMLGMGSFDGLAETFWWLERIGVNPLDFQGRSTIILPTLAGMASSMLGLIFVFWLTAWLGRRLSAGVMEVQVPPSQGAVFAALAISTLPIFLGFHFAHFLPTLLVWGQYTLLSLNDPLATGHNLIGLAGFRVRLGFLAEAGSVHLIWLVQGTVIVVSHVFAVIMAHAALQRLFGNARAAFRAELPIAVFLIAYTWFGLWLLATARGA